MDYKKPRQLNNSTNWYNIHVTESIFLIYKILIFRATVWAKFCFPDKDWTNDDSLKLLHSQQKMLCSKHFDDSSFTSSDRKRLNKFAMPSEARDAYLVSQPSTSSNLSYVSEHAQDIQVNIFLISQLYSECNPKVLDSRETWVQDLGKMYKLHFMLEVKIIYSWRYNFLWWALSKNNDNIHNLL